MRPKTSTLRPQTAAAVILIAAVLLSALFLHEPLSLRSAIGAVLILGSALFSEMI